MDSSRSVQAALAVVMLILAPQAAKAADLAAKQSLKSRHRVGELSRVEVALQVGGDLKLVVEGKPKSIPMSVIANIGYDEQLLATDEAGHPRRTLRYYNDTRAVIKVDQGGDKPKLDDAHRLIAVERLAGAAPVLFCPSGALKREELDLIDVPGNSMLGDSLLPSERVAFGESWKLTDQTMAALLCLDAVSWTDVTSVQGETKDGIVEIAAAGSVNGAAGGVGTEIELKAKYRFDLARGRLVYLAMLIKEKRAVGHIGPGLDTVAKLIVSMTPIEKSSHLTQEVVARTKAELTPDAESLDYAAVSGQFRFPYDRRWHLTVDDAKLAILRLMDKGELVAQCNVSILPSEKKSPVTLAEFQQDVQTSLGKNFGQFTNASQSTNEAGYAVLRVVAHGVVSELPIEWVYYLIQDSQGKRVSLAFTYEQDLAERFAQADRAMVQRLRMTETPASTAAKPVQQQ